MSEKAGYFVGDEISIDRFEYRLTLTLIQLFTTELESLVEKNSRKTVTSRSAKSKCRKGVLNTSRVLFLFL